MRDLIRTTQINKDCPTCKGEGYVLTAVYSHPTIPDGTERYEICDECKHNES